MNCHILEEEKEAFLLNLLNCEVRNSFVILYLILIRRYSLSIVNGSVLVVLIRNGRGCRRCLSRDSIVVTIFIEIVIVSDSE